MKCEEQRLQGKTPMESLPPLLTTAVALLKTLEPEHAGIAAKFEELKGRLLEGRFHLAVLGQFKRGKSTILNALLGAEVLATSVVPLTAIPTFLSWGERRRARIAFSDTKPPEDRTFPDDGALHAFLEGYVTETGNPKNRLNVSHVEVFLPAAILQKGVVLVDTPGIGSTFRHNTEATLNFLSQCDAALFIVSADPPVTEVEIEFLGQVRTKVPHLCFIMNKVDYLDSSERATALEFFGQVLASHGGLATPAEIFSVSARRGLKGRLANDPLLWKESGLEALEAHLVDFLATGKSRALAAAISRKALALTDELIMSVEVRLRSMAISIEELERRLGTFEEKLKEIEQERLTSQDLLKGTNRRMHEYLEEYSEDLRKRSFTYLDSLVREVMEKGNGAGGDETALREAVAQAIPGYFEHETGKAVKVFEAKMGEALRPFQTRTDELIGAIRRTAAELFDIPYQAPESADAFRMVEQPYWVTHKWRSGLRSFAGGFLSRFSSAATIKARMLARIAEQLRALVIENVENLRWPIFQSLDQTFLRFGSDLDNRLKETVAATHGAMRATLDYRRNRADQIEPMRRRYTDAIRQLEELRCAFGAAAGESAVQGRRNNG
ncbi:MAG TPA: dynamin family protein [Candidatus Ozemobacteraceae bacterium]|nr:dynamin family protein [Candidatus Ozemobacteraceae bacterium]